MRMMTVIDKGGHCMIRVETQTSVASASLHTVKFELTNQHSVGGKNCGVLTSCRFCALRFDFCVISESLYCGDAVLCQRFLQINRLPYFNLLKSQLFAIISAG